MARPRLVGALRSPLRREGSSITRRSVRGLIVEIGLWVTASALLAPLLLYAGSANMPIAALFSVAGGIAMAIALAGRQLHEVLLADALTARKGTAKLLLAAGMMLLVVLLVLLGVVVALLLLFRSSGISAIDGGAGIGR